MAETFTVNCYDNRNRGIRRGFCGYRKEDAERIFAEQYLQDWHVKMYDSNGLLIMERKPESVRYA
jgi:hypothetical protein